GRQVRFSADVSGQMGQRPRRGRHRSDGAARFCTQRAAWIAGGEGHRPDPGAADRPRGKADAELAGTDRERPAYRLSMSVLQMAMPVAGFLPKDARPNKAARSGAVRRAAQAVMPIRRERGDSAPAKPTRDTLLPPAIVPVRTPAKAGAQAGAHAGAIGRKEAMLQRTAEQQATEEALGRLVRQCMAGDQHAWQQLVTTQHRRIYAICYRFTGSASDAEDLTQDVFLKLYRNLGSFDT